MNARNIEYLNLEELSSGDYRVNDGEADITGWIVKDESSAEIGKVRDLLFDPTQNAIRYVIVDLRPELVGGEGKAVLFPIGYVNLGDDKSVVLPVMHEGQYQSMPNYIINEVTRDTEMQIRAAIGSPAALRIEEEIAEGATEDFYQHHHFDRGNIISRHQFAEQSNPSILPEERVEESNTIHELVERSSGLSSAEVNADYHSENADYFVVDTTSGKYGIEPQDNGTYRIIDGESKIGVIYAEAGENGVKWHTMDDLEDNFVNTIGEGITAYHNRTSL
ncbi:PRC-barrel domain-containing protein [Pedobacter sandarakinus]|uniref:PRC-barrel domain-containing protein n=1 Tax=Pedobacter sandarakinus TaxID=353156 RepID=UPI002246FD16|nr:PRC-barrel domain-containing protein [Pedobacter sandarakinus]